MTDNIYMLRCLDLARKGSGHVSPNPMVGAVLVHQGNIIGEGWHQHYGGPHAEVNCINSVAEENRNFINQSTVYVSLEPCVHHGKTPPCADLIIKHGIPKVVIGCTDSFTEVSGKGIERLKNAGIDVRIGVLEKDCRSLNKRFFTRHERGRPYIILKWAESTDGFIAPPKGKRVMLSNAFSQIWVHKMRSEEDAILVGYNTALQDNPQLNNRYGGGKQPLRVIVDLTANLPLNLNVFEDGQKTIVLNYLKEKKETNVQWIKINNQKKLAEEIINHLPKEINSIIIEGGCKTLQHFIHADLWDEAAVIKTNHRLLAGVPAPVFNAGNIVEEMKLKEDRLTIYQNGNPRTLS